MTPKWLKWTWWSIKEQTSYKWYSSEHNYNVLPPRKRFDPNKAHQRRDRCSKQEIQNMFKGSNVLPRHSMQDLQEIWHLTSLCYKKKVSLGQEHPRCISYKWVRCTCKTIPHVASQVIWCPVMNPFVYKLRYNAHKIIQDSTPHHLIINLAYRLKPHHRRNQYLRAD